MTQDKFLSKAQIEEARIEAGIELEDSFEAGSKWCVGDEELRNFAHAIAVKILTKEKGVPT